MANVAHTTYAYSLCYRKGGGDKNTLLEALTPYIHSVIWHNQLEVLYTLTAYQHLVQPPQEKKKEKKRET